MSKKLCSGCISYRTKAHYERGKLAGYCIKTVLFPGLSEGYTAPDGKTYGETSPSGSCPDYDSAGGRR